MITPNVISRLRMFVPLVAAISIGLALGACAAQLNLGGGAMADTKNESQMDPARAKRVLVVLRVKYVRLIGG